MAKTGDLVYLDSFGMVEIAWVGYSIAAVKLTNGSTITVNLSMINDSLEKTQLNLKYYMHKQLLGENKV
jgi:hypothetical protein